MQVDSDDRIVGFQEKPQEPPPMPGDPDAVPGVDGHLRLHRPAHVRTAVPGRHPAGQRSRLRQEHHSRHDRDATRCSASASATRTARPTPYWRDVGTLDAYYQANMDLVDVDPVLNLYDREWPIRTYQPQLPPPKFVFRDEDRADSARRGEAHDSMVCQGCIISGGHVRRSILSPNVRVNSYALVENSILFDGVDVGRHCRIRRAIIDKEVNIPQHDHRLRPGPRPPARLHGHRAGRGGHRQGGAAGDVCRQNQESASRLTMAQEQYAPGAAAGCGTASASRLSP